MFSGRRAGTNSLTFANPRIVLSIPPHAGDAPDPSGDVIEQALRGAGASVEVVHADAVDADEVIELAPDLFLIDIRSPGGPVRDEPQAPSVSGLIRAVHESGPAEPTVPIIALLDDPSPAAREHLFAVGADEVLLKPFDLAELFVRLDNLLQTRHLHVELQLRNAELRREVDRLRSANETLRSLVRDLQPGLLGEHGLDDD